MVNYCENGKRMDEIEKNYVKESLQMKMKNLMIKKENESTLKLIISCIIIMFINYKICINNLYKLLLRIYLLEKQKLRLSSPSMYKI